MVTRDSTVQLAVVGLVFAFGAAAGLLGIPGLLDGVMYGLWVLVVFAGSHVYLAVQGDGDYVPVDARWRFVGLAAVFTAVVLLYPRAAGVTVGRVRLSTALWAGFLALFVGYVGYESWDAYRRRRPS